ncbi:hypothetical protein Tco_0298429 [Tanacetum coccineum]
MPVYDTDIEDVIEEEEGFVGIGGFDGEEDNIEDVVVVANDLCSSMIQTILSVDFEEDINTKSHELMSFEKSIIIKTVYPIGWSFVLDTAYGSRVIRRIGNWSNALSCEVQAAIRQSFSLDNGDDGIKEAIPLAEETLVHDEHYDNPLLEKEIESKPIIMGYRGREEEYPFVNKYPSFQEELSIPLRRKRNDRKGGFGGEEDNIEDVVVVANDLLIFNDPIF